VIAKTDREMSYVTTVRRSTPLRFILTLSLLVSSTFALAEDWYRIEVIGFRYPVAEGASWAAAQTAPDFSGAQRLLATADTNADTEALSDDATPVAYATLAPTALDLAGAYQRLEQNPGYQPVFHTGWWQSASDSRPVYFTDLAAVTADAPVTGFEGTIRLAAAKEGIRVTSNFIVRLPDTAVAINEARNVVAGELHYLDHPLLGLLVQVTPRASPPSVDSELPLEPTVEAPR
jgi:Peptidoglycan-binding protein, CsiV